MIGRLKHVGRRWGGALLLLLGVFLVLPASAHAQSQSSCTANTVDYANGGLGSPMTDVEETVCLYYDGVVGLDATVSTENDSYEDFEPYVDGDTWDGYYVANDMWVYGVGAQAQIWGSGGTYDLLSDSGMNNGSTDSTDVTYGYADTNATASAQYNTFVLSSLYDECEEDPTDGDAGQNCNWQSSWGLSVQLQVSIPKLTPTVSLSTSATPTLVGQPVTFTALVTASGATPTGSVTFYDGSTGIAGPSGLSGGVATLTTGSLALGNHTITAFYSGDASYSQATSYASTQTVNPNPVNTIVLAQNSIYGYAVEGSGGASGYAANGNVMAYTDLVNGTWSLGYDGLNRLTSGSATAGHFAGLQMGWSYDSFGNRTSESFGGNPSVALPTGSSAQYNANNQVSASSLMGGAGLIYDAAGNVIQDNQNRYLYDGDGRVCAVQALYLGAPTGAVTGYLYDADGNRVAKGTLSGFDCSSSFTETNWYVLGQSGEQLTETDGQGTWLHTNVYAAGQLIATYDSQTNNTVFAVTDWLGTKRVEIGANNCATAYTGLPFGNGLTPVSVPGYTQCPDDATEHHFTAKERDAESGNDYFDARYYSSNMGRFMSPDWSAKEEPVPYAKLDNPQTLNLYNYMRNNPLGGVDPDGHCCEADFDSFQTPEQAAYAKSRVYDDGDKQFYGHSDNGQWTAGFGMVNVSTTANTGNAQLNSTGTVALQPIPSIGLTVDVTVHAPGATPNPVSVSAPVTPLLSVSATTNSATVSVGPAVGPKSPVNISGDVNAAAKVLSSAANSVASTARGAIAPTPPTPPTPKPPSPPSCSVAGACPH
jgi:RHS repeat-associated protein